MKLVVSKISYKFREDSKSFWKILKVSRTLMGEVEGKLFEKISVSESYCIFKKLSIVFENERKVDIRANAVIGVRSCLGFCFELFD